MKMKLKISIVCALLGTSILTYASDNQSNLIYQDSTRYAIETSITTGGNVSVGGDVYTKNFEAGIFGGGKISNGDSQTRLFTPGGFVGLRKFLCNTTVFAYGLDASTTFGKDSGKVIHYSYTVGPYVSLEQIFTDHIMLAVWYNPYLYTLEKKAEVITRTHNFGAGGIGIKYLF